MKNKKWLIIIAYFNVCFLWGTNNLATRIGVNNMAPLQFSGLRFLFAGIVLTAITFIKGDSLKFPSYEYKHLFLLGGIMFFLTNGCVVYGNKYLDSGIVTVLLSTIPIFTTLLEFMVYKKTRSTVFTISGLCLGFFGIIVVTLFGKQGITINPIGVAFTLVAAIFWCIGSLYSKNHYISGSVISQTAVESMFAAVLLLGVNYLMGDFSLAAINISSLLPIIYLAVFDSVIGFVSYIFLLKVLPTATACTYAYINPIVALILGYFVLGEPLSFSKILGMIIILIGVMLIQASDTFTKILFIWREKNV